MGTKIERFVSPDVFDEVKFSEFRCPVELQDVSQPKKEIWLIKAPSNFDGPRLDGLTLNLNGEAIELDTMPDEAGKKYEAFSFRTSQDNEVQCPYLVLPGSEEEGSKMEAAPSFVGQITIMESPSLDIKKNPEPITSVAPKIPDGLRQRFKPFGWEEPWKPSESMSPASGKTPNSSREQALESKKKKKVKRRHDSDEAMVTEGDSVVNEQADAAAAAGESDLISSPKKKKKKKKSKE